MTRATRPRAARHVPGDDRMSTPSIGGFVAPALAAVGLLVVAWLTWGLATGDFRVPGIPVGNGPPGVSRTPAPSNVVVVDPRANIPGSLAYVKAGNVWIQTGTKVRQLTTSGRASMPTWSGDGQWIYFIDTVEQLGRFPAGGQARRYGMSVPYLLRIRADGSAPPEQVTTGRFRTGRYTWFYWIRDPAASPDGQTIALVSDAPDPTQSSVVVQLLDLETGKLTRPNLPETRPYGHQDPAWRPDGRLLLYVRNGRDGARGTPSIWRYDPATKRASAVTGPGYLAPAWSRDGQYIAATRTDAFGTNVVILDARGTEVLRLTDDDRSWSPAWSPLGDAIVFLHLDGGIVDLRLARLAGTRPSWTVGETTNVTEVSGLDGASRPGWFVPAADLPPLPTPPPSTSAGTSPSGSTTAP